MKKALINHKLNTICKRIDELCEGAASCTDPFLLYNLQASIAILIERQSELCKRLTEEA